MTSTLGIFLRAGAFAVAIGALTAPGFAQGDGGGDTKGRQPAQAAPSGSTGSSGAPAPGMNTGQRDPSPGSVTGTGAGGESGAAGMDTPKTRTDPRSTPNAPVQ